MRLLVVSQYYWPENFRVNDLVAELVARGHEVTVLTGLPNYPEGHVYPEFRAAPERYAQHAGATVLRVPVIPRGQGKARLLLNYLSFVVSGAIVGPWRLRGRDFDAIFVFQTSPITSALPALLLRRIKKAPLLMWVLDLWPETLAAVGVVRSPRLLGWVGRLVTFIYRRCDRILVQSHAFVANVERYAGGRERVRYFPAWAEPAFTGSLEAVEPAPETLPYRDTFNVLFAGNIGEAQDLNSVLDAAQALRERTDVRWLIVGEGRAAEGLRGEIARRGLQEHVVMLGRHPVERMPSFFRGAGALLVSLKPDPVLGLVIPGKVQSYMAAGVPILGMLDGEGARVVAESGGGLVCPAGHGRELAANVVRLVEMPRSERAAMGARGRDYCKREFDRHTLISAFERWAAELAAVPAGGRPPADRAS